MKKHIQLQPANVNKNLKKLFENNLLGFLFNIHPSLLLTIFLFSFFT